MRKSERVWTGKAFTFWFSSKTQIYTHLRKSERVWVSRFAFWRKWKSERLDLRFERKWKWFQESERPNFNGISTSGMFFWHLFISPFRIVFLLCTSRDKGATCWQFCDALLFTRLVRRTHNVHISLYFFVEQKSGIRGYIYLLLCQNEYLCYIFPAF